MLRGVTKLENAVALAVESVLPYPTSKQSGWKWVTHGRKKLCVAAARAAIKAIEETCSISFRKHR